MTHIHWNPAFSFGVQELDDQHKRLVCILNNMRESLASNDAERTASALFDALAITLRSHIFSEESLMRRHGYSGLDNHQKKHHQILEQLDVTARGISAGNRQLARDVLDFIESWWQNHVRNDDSQFVQSLSSQRYL